MKDNENIEKLSNFNSPSGVRDSYTQTLQYLYDRLPVFQHIGGEAYKPGLENSIRLMSSLYNPQNKYPTIHIAGTNGKGSVSHLLAAVLQKAGYKVGLYTSPHLDDFGERIRVNGKMIEQQYVIDFVERHKNLFANIEPSFFEATMAMAFNFFADCQVDVAVIEVGLGGRLDSTNIIIPVLSIITNISFDHVGFLGNTLQKIAFEKAGIIKANTPVVIGETQSETCLIFEEISKNLLAPIYFADEHFKISFIGYSDGKMQVETSDKKLLNIGLCGIYQLKNIVTVLAAIEKLNSLNFKIPELAIQEGLENVVAITGLQGRWQKLNNNPTVVCDTGHNVGGMEYIVEQLKTQQYKTLHIVFGMVNDKDISAVLALLPTKARYYFAQANIARALPANELKEKAKSSGLIGLAYLSVKQAIDAVLSETKSDDFIFIGGSNFVVGEALPLFEK